MHDLVSFNHHILPAGDVRISSLSSAALYGKGIFTTVAIHGRQPFLWEKHWQRLEQSAGKLKIDLGEFSERDVRDQLEKVVESNGVSRGRSRITFFDGSQSSLWPFDPVRETHLLIVTGDVRVVPDNFRLTVSPYQINSFSPLSGIKSCNYLEKIMALDETRSRGFDEAIQLNERGEIVSATMANIYWLKDDALYTPGLDTGCLPGTTREFILENVECREVNSSIDALHSADAIFLTSAGLGVVPVNEWGSNKLLRLQHPITTLLPQ